MSYVSCIVYDLDGTLIESAADIAAALNRVRAAYDLEPLDADHVRLFVGSGAEELVKCGIFGLVDDPVLRPTTRLPRTAADLDEVVAQFRGVYAEDPVIHTALKKGVAPMLKHWQAEGTAQVVLTNKPHEITVAVLEALYLGKIFDLVIGRGRLDDDGAVLPAKPDPAIMDWILEQTGAERDETWIVGDGLPDMELAKAAGVGAIPILDGYTDPEVLLASAPDLDLAATSIAQADEFLRARHDG